MIVGSLSTSLVLVTTESTV